MNTPKPKRLGKRQQTLLANLREGGKILISHEDGTIKYFLEGSPEHSGLLEPRLVLSLLKRKLVQEEADAMFGCSQAIGLSPAA